MADDAGGDRPTRSKRAIIVFLVLLVLAAALVSWIVTQGDAGAITTSS